MGIANAQVKARESSDMTMVSQIRSPITSVTAALRFHRTPQVALQHDSLNPKEILLIEGLVEVIHHQQALICEPSSRPRPGEAG